MDSSTYITNEFKRVIEEVKNSIDDVSSVEEKDKLDEVEHNTEVALYSIILWNTTAISNIIAPFEVVPN